jgi:hypothetical protein
MCCTSPYTRVNWLCSETDCFKMFRLYCISSLQESNYYVLILTASECSDCIASRRIQESTDYVMILTASKCSEWIASRHYKSQMIMFWPWLLQNVLKLLHLAVFKSQLTVFLHLTAFTLSYSPFTTAQMTVLTPTAFRMLWTDLHLLRSQGRKWLCFGSTWTL